MNRRGSVHEAGVTAEEELEGRRDLLGLPPALAERNLALEVVEELELSHASPVSYEPTIRQTGGRFEELRGRRRARREAGRRKDRR